MVSKFEEVGQLLRSLDEIFVMTTPDPSEFDDMYKDLFQDESYEIKDPNINEKL